MKRPLLHLRLLLALAITVAVGLAPRQGSASIVVDPALVERLRTAAPGDNLGLILTYDHRPTTTDLQLLKPLVLKRVTFHRLPMVAVIATPAQVRGLKSLAGLRSIYLNRPLQNFLHESVETIRATSVWSDYGVNGRGIGVAIVDTGLDASHPDLALGQTTRQNVKVAGLQYAAGVNLDKLDLPVFFQENVSNTDLTSGHGTHVAGIVAASGAGSNGYYKGVAPGAHLVGLGAGDVIEIFTALASFDYVLEHRATYNIRVVNCSWGNIVPGFDPNDPVNQATNLLYRSGVTVVFASGNSGAKTDSLNTYSVAPWVIGVAAGEKQDEAGSAPGLDVAFFSSRGIPGHSFYHPTLTAPGYLIVSDRTVTGAAVNSQSTPIDPAYVKPEYLASYTTANGTSMAAPHVAGVVALMLQANPKLTPGVIKRVLINTAMPMPNYQQWQAGAGYLNARGAVRVARQINNVTAYVDPPREATVNRTAPLSGTLLLSTPATLSVVTHTVVVRRYTRSLEVTIDWLTYAEDLSLRLYAPDGTLAATSDAIQSVYSYANETVHVNNPAVGAWRVEVSGIVSAVTPYTGASNAVVATR